MNEPQAKADSDAEMKIPDTGGFNLGRVLKTILVLSLIGGSAFALFEYWNNQTATLVKTTGRVMWDGQPVVIGAIMTEHVSDLSQFSIGGLDAEGKFELLTNGVPGAALGTHKVIVASYGPGMGTTPLVPKEYLKAKTSPLSIVVTRDPAKNHFELEIFGEKPNYNQAGGPPGGGPPGGGPPGGGPPGGGAPRGGAPRGGGRPPQEGPAETPAPAEPAIEAVPAASPSADSPKSE